jgi:glycerol-3-phosphate dehydrogenase
VKRALASLADADLDVLVVGGGIHGAWTARWAAARGLDAGLVEAVDYASGTSSRSTMLAHGGLRYLAQYDFGLVREALTERAHLVHKAPHLVRPLRFLLPFYEEAPYPDWQLRTGVRLYSLLAHGSGFPRHELLTKRQVLELEPGLRAEGLTGGALYWDAQILSPERLTTLVAREADDRGAHLANHARAVDLLGQDRIEGAVVEDALAGDELQVDADVVVNATGPFLDRFLAETGLEDGMVRLTKGIHLATPPFTDHAVVVNATDDRTFFAVPWHDHQWVGTTDTDYTDDPRDVHATSEDVSYLQDSLRQYFPDAPVDEVRFTNAGLRNLLNVEGVHPSDVSRGAEIHDHASDGRPGMVSLVGGKLTTARATAGELLDAARGYLEAYPEARDTDRRLPGGDVDPARAYRQARQLARKRGLSDATAARLVRLYGAEWPHVAGAGLDPLGEEASLLAGETERAVAVESARTATDVLRRRTLAWAGPDRGREALPEVGRLLQRGGVPADVAEASLEGYERRLARHERWRD